MDLHHLRRFVILAEELHFTRAAARLHIEQPPLSRSIKELESELGVSLFSRDRRGTRLTSAGQTLLHDAGRVFSALKLAQDNIQAVACGARGSLHMAVSDDAIDLRLVAFLARCREETPEIDIHLSEVSLAEQIRGLRCGDFMLGLARTPDVGDDIATEPIWHDALVAAIPSRHPLLVHTAIPLHALEPYPLVLCDAPHCAGYGRELSRLLYPLEHAPHVIAHAASQDMMLTLVSAGYGVGFITTDRFALCRYPHVLIRPLAIDSSTITTYLLRPNNTDPPAWLERLTTHLHACADV